MKQRRYQRPGDSPGATWYKHPFCLDAILHALKGHGHPLSIIHLPLVGTA